MTYKDDYPFSIPRSALLGQHSGHSSRITQRLRWPARHFDFLQFAVRDKAEVAAIRRPKRVHGALRSRERLGGELIERAHPELSPEPRVQRPGQEGQAVAVR